MSQVLPRYKTPAPEPSNQNVKSSASITDPSRKLVKQTCGFIISTLGFIVSIFSLLDSIYSVITADDLFILRILLVLSYSLVAYFYYSILFVPEYAAGKPDYLKFCPLGIGLISRCILMIIFARIGVIENDHIEIAQVLFTICGLLFTYYMYMLDDESGSCCLFFKPWVYKTIPPPVPPIQNPIEIKNNKLMAPFNV